VVIEAGQQLLHYRLVEKIGEGGMGVVWKAVDTTLDREVAIKFLPEWGPSASGGQPPAIADRLARFEREAKLLASLNHPNIAAVYGLHEAQGIRFIAMECVAGEDLGQRLVRGALSIDDALDAARQVAEALETAHEQGVIHRDLKPANVKLAPDGKVKVLDFGLAKALDHDPATDSPADPSASPTMTSGGTRNGVIMGTAAYMSPEQARGKPVDRRADIWAFGCLLYEVLTGKRAFPGDTVSDTLVAVLSREPEWAALSASTPAAVHRLLRRCVTKDSKRRLRDIGEARILLEDAIAGDSAGVASDVAPTAEQRSPLGRWIGLGGIALLLFGAGWFLSPSDDTTRGINSDARIRSLTSDEGLEYEPDLSPDGNYVAYTTDAAGNLDIEILPLQGGNVNRLVDHAADDAQPCWSPDGTHLAFVSARDYPGGLLGSVGGMGEVSQFVSGVGGDIFLIPALGGSVTKLVEKGLHPAWSPDGSALAYVSEYDTQADQSSSAEAAPLEIWRIPVEGGDPVRLTNDSATNLQPAWSPDGRWIAYACYHPPGLRVVSAEGGGQPLDIYDGVALNPAWSADGRWIYFSSDRTAAPGVYNLWRIRVDRKGRARSSPERVKLGGGSDIDVSLSADGTRLVFGSVRFAPDLWVLTLADGSLERITTTLGHENYPHLNPDGRRLVFESDRAGADERVWALDLIDGRLQQLGTAGSAKWPRWSPNGDLLAYQSIQPNETRLVVQRWGDVNPRVITTEAEAGTVAPQWSPDGKRLVTFGNAVWVHTLDGESTQIVPDGGGVFPTWSPTGNEIAFQHQVRAGAREIWAVSTEGGEPRLLSRGDGEYSHPQWCPTDPDLILVVVEHKDLGLLRVSTGEVERITDLAASTVLVDYPSWSADGRQVLFSLARRSGDVYLIEGF
jgi:Tol biopolymer transport system component